MMMANRRATWAGVRGSVSVVAAAGYRVFAAEPFSEAGNYDANEAIPARRASRFGNSNIPDKFSIPNDGGLGESRDRSGRQDRNPFSDVYALEGQKVENDAGSRPGDEKSILSMEEAKAVEEPYSVFSKRNKWLIIVLISAAGLFSGLSSNIFFPALDQIAQDLKVKVEDVSLTITSYLVIQGIAPVIWGSFADTVGRRPIYLASFTVYIIANIALSFSPNFAVLLIFRGLQAAGSASTVSIGNGVIQDISPPAERGAYISFYQAIRNFSIAVGPVLGGILANFLGFRSIFVLLFILSSFTTVAIILFLPETLRSIAGNGSIRLEGIYQPLIRYLKRHSNEKYADPDTDPAIMPRRRVTSQTFIEPLKLLTRKDIILNLLFGGVVYAIWSMVTASTTPLFKGIFALNELQIGLAFLPNGIGTIVGSAITAKLMTVDFLAAEAKYAAKHNLPLDYKLPKKDLPTDFPIEHARLRRLTSITILFVSSLALYGLSLAFSNLTARTGWIAVPLILQLLIAATSNAVFALNQTLLADLCPGRGASATAINNLVRCSLGAFGVALVDRMIAGVGVGAAFASLALFVLVCAPLPVVNWYWGQQWRVEAQEQVAERKSEA